VISTNTAVQRRHPADLLGHQHRNRRSHRLGRHGHQDHVFGTEPPAQQQAGTGRDQAADYQRSQGRPQQLANTPQVQVERDRQGHGGRAQQDVHDFGALAVLGVGHAARHQYTDHHQHRYQYRLQEDPAGLVIGRQHQLIGPQGDTDAEQRVVDDRIEGAVPVQAHGFSSRRA
jgi:hypothetical protein